MNEDFKDALSDRIKAVTRAKALRGEAIFATAPFGYGQSGTAYVSLPDGAMRSHPSGPLVPHDEEAPIVRELFERYVAGASLSSMAAELNARAVPRRRGALWTVSGLVSTIRNPVYAGHVHLYDVIVAAGKHEAIVEPALWDAAQAKYARTVTIRRQSPNDLASWCEGHIEHVCGGRMYLVPVAGRRRLDGTRKTRGNFICRTANVAAVRCAYGRRMMLMPKAERLARACLIVDLGAIGSLSDAIARAEARAGGDLADRQRAIIAVKRAAVERRRARARESWMAGLDDLTVWQAEHAAYLVAVAELDRDLARLPATPDAARYRETAAMLAGFAEAIAHADDPALGAVIDDIGVIVVREAGVSIRYHAIVSDLIPAPVTRI